MRAKLSPDAASLIVECLAKAFGDRLLAVMLFGSRARGDCRPDSDYDIFVLLDDYVSDPVRDYFSAYTALRPFRDELVTDTTVVVASLRDLGRSVSSPLVLNALVEGVVVYDREGTLTRVRRKLLDKLRSLGVERVRVEWGYTWRVPQTVELPFRVDVDVKDPPSYQYRLRLAREHLEEAVKALGASALVAAIHEAQLSIENSAKAVIAVFKPPSWVHNPGPELRELVREGRAPSRRARSAMLRLAEIAEEAAPHHALSSYGDVRREATPRDIYTEGDARRLVGMASEALRIATDLIAILTQGLTS